MILFINYNYFKHIDKQYDLKNQQVNQQVTKLLSVQNLK